MSPLPAQFVPWFLETYDGPVVHIARDGLSVTVKAANATAQPYLQDRAWLAHLPDSGRQTLRHKTRAEDLVVEWQMLPLGPSEALLLGRDQTLESSLTLALADSRTRFKDLLALSADSVWETDRGGRFSYISTQGFLGWPADMVVGKRPHELGLTPPDALATPFLAQKIVREARIWLPSQTGELRCLAVSAHPLVSDDGAWCGARGLCRDVTQEQQAATDFAAVRTRERLVDHIVRILRDGLSPELELSAAARALAHALSGAGVVIYRRVADTWEVAAHYGEDIPAAAPVLCEATLNRGDTLPLTGAGHDWLVCRTQYQRKVNGAVAAWRASGKPWSHDDVHLMDAVAAQFGTVWAQVNFQEELSAKADRDGLTGLLNQRAFKEQMQARFERVNQKDGLAVLVNLDLDNFKTINDHLGHPKGDEVLQGVGQVLKDAVRAGDLVGRVGGDEFVLWLDRTDLAGAQQVSERILAGIRALADKLPELPKRLGASIGLAPVRAGDTLAALITRADTTMYDAKHSGKGRIVVAEAP